MTTRLTPLTRKLILKPAMFRYLKKKGLVQPKKEE